MTVQPSPLSKGWIRIDVLLAGLAVVGLILYVLLMPAQHPDAAASYALGKAAAEEAAEAFLAESGYALDEYDVEVALRRDTELLKALQADLGRPEALRLLREGAEEIPAYHWRVRYRRAPEEGEPPEPPYLVHVTASGAVWDFERALEPVDRPFEQRPARRLRPSRRVDRSAFQTVLSRSGSEPGVEAAAAVDFSIITDSLIAASFSFNPEDSLWHRDPAAVPPFDGTKERTTIRRYVEENPTATLTVGMPPAYAVALARYHLQRTIWGADAFRADSVWLLPERDNRLARVRLVRSEPVHGQQVEARVTVTAGGALLELDTEFNTEASVFTLGVEATTEEGMNAQTEGSAGGHILEIVAEAAEAIVLFALVVALIVAFFKRLAARLIDGKSAFLDMAVVGLCGALLIGLNKELDLDPMFDSIWLRVLMTTLMALLGGAGIGLFALVLSGATDSLTRAVWSKKLHSVSLLRLGAVRNVFVGGALLRGVGLALVLLGLVAGLLALFPGASLHFENSAFLDAQSWQPMTWQVAISGVGTYVILTLVLLGVGTFVYRLRKQAGVVVGAIVVTMGLVQGAPVQLEPVVYNWLISLLWGAALGLAFWRFDFLTCFTGFAVAHLVWSLSEGWLVEGSPILLDVGLAGVFVLGLVVLGVLGVASGETRRAAAEYVPTYITDLKHRERLKSELDVARQVQESFLPRRMPKVAGLDIAAMCLAAYEVGGDYYDFVDVGPGKLAVVVGDVSGKGTQAAFYMTLTKGILQTLSREGFSPAEVMRRLNTLFCANAPRGTFISMIYGVFDVEARTFTFARAGHNPVILKRSPSQDPDLIQPTGLAIGLVPGATFDDTIEERTLDLRIGDVLVFYTDGFSEAMNQVKDLYGDDRLARKVGDVGQRSAAEILHAVAEDVHHFVEAAGRHDDMTMVVVKLERSLAFAPSVSERQHVTAEA